MTRRLTSFFQQGKDWKFADTTNKNFLEKNCKLLKYLVIGCSFSPEQIEFLNKKEKYSKLNDKKVKPLECLKVIVEQFKINDIRLGIRWNQVDNGKEIDISYYEPLLNYCFKKNVNVTLNVGPIKTFRWPEQFVPQYILDKVDQPPVKSYIQPNSDLALEAGLYLEKLFKKLKSSFTAKQLEQIKIIQLENEPFHPFGIFRWRMSEEYMDDLMQITLKYFPDVSFLINSSETSNVKKIAKYYKKNIQRNLSLRNRLISGYNFFYHVPGVRYIPFFGVLDSITLSNLTFQRVHKKNIEWAKTIGFKIEITEAQTEPWLPIVSPGSSSREFKFMLLRSVNNLLNYRQKSVLRVWGIEHLSLSFVKEKITKEQEEIIDLIKKINL